MAICLDFCLPLSRTLSLSLSLSLSLFLCESVAYDAVVVREVVFLLLLPVLVHVTGVMPPAPGRPPHGSVRRFEMPTRNGEQRRAEGGRLGGREGKGKAKATTLERTSARDTHGVTYKRGGGGPRGGCHVGYLNVATGGIAATFHPPTSRSTAPSCSKQALRTVFGRVFARRAAGEA